MDGSDGFRSVRAAQEGGTERKKCGHDDEQIQLDDHHPRSSKNLMQKVKRGLMAIF